MPETEFYAKSLTVSYLALINDLVNRVFLDSNDDTMVKVKDVLCNCYESLMDLEMELEP